MIEIRKIREYTPKGNKNVNVAPKKFEVPFDPDIKAENLSDLFKELDTLVGKIPEAERYNCYFTLGHAPPDKDGKGRKWQHQDVIPFDIDDCEYIDDAPNPKYLDAIQEALQVDLEKCVVIATGNGLQVLVKPNFIINDAKWFTHNGKYYQALCHKISDTLQAKGLKGKLDASAFEANRLFRLPLTFNIKPNKPKRLARMLKSRLSTSDFDLQAVSGLPVLDETVDTVPERDFSRLKLDASAIESGCEFLKWSKTHPQNVTEPLWYAMLSVIGRLPDGERLAQEYSKEHTNYSERETERKLRQSLDASGPRTCANINKHWGKCKECPNFNKVVSPIQLKGPNFISTIDSGFHNMGSKGGLTPNYMDLLKFYEQKNPFMNINGTHYRFEKTHWLESSEAHVKAFAQDHFDPVCNNNKAAEFSGIVLRHNNTSPDFFTTSIERRINLANGVVNIDTLTLEPHSEKYGFQYCLPFKFDAIAEAPMFAKFMAEITCHDQKLEDMLLEFMGYAISNDVPDAQKFLVMMGEGNNGKTTLINILNYLGGEGARSLSPKQIFESPFDVILLNGALFNVIEEMPKYSKSDFWDRMKAMITGTPVTASKKGKDAFKFVVKAKFIMLCNALPKGGEPSRGFFRRFIVAPFEAEFSHEKGNLVVGIDRKIIDTEMSGVLNMVLRGYHRLIENNYQFTKSPKTEAALAEYKLVADNVSKWASEHVIAGQPKHQSPDSPWIVPAASNELVACVTKMRDSYVQWVQTQGEHPVAMDSFSKRLYMYLKDQKIPFEAKVASVSGRASRVVKGITFVDHEAEF